MVDIHAKRIESPLHRIILYLNKYDPDRLEDEKLSFLLKNMPTHFEKLFYSTAFLNKIQKDDTFIKKYDHTKIVSIQTIEYCYYKISTIWDISYQIADKLIVLTKEKAKKYDYLDEKFESYVKNLNGLQLDWYREFNKIRNRIVHGGITVNSYYVDEKEVKKRICFQAYDFDLNDLIKPHYIYSNSYNNNINFADNYFVFYTHLLYSYLSDFFEFVLLEMCKETKNDIKELSSGPDFEYFERARETWLLSDVDTFVEITDAMIALEINEGMLIDNREKINDKVKD